MRSKTMAAPSPLFLLTILSLSLLLPLRTAAAGDLTAGCWVGRVGQESYVFRFEHRAGRLACMTHTLRDGKQTMQMAADEVVFDAPDLRLAMPTGVVYTGAVDFRDGRIDGSIEGRTGKGMELPLTYADPESLPGLLARGADDPAAGSRPDDAGDGWKIAAPEEVGLDPGAIAGFVEGVIAGRAGLLHSCLVARSGRLVAEEYFHGYGAQDLHALASACKSVSSLLVGAAIDDGDIEGVDEPLRRWFPVEEYPRGEGWADPTLRDLLKMSLGLDWSAREAEAEHGTGEDFFREVLARDAAFAPGERWLYVNAEVDLLSGVLAEATGEGPEIWARKKLFKPLGITEWRWNYGAEGEHRLMDGSLHLRPRDMLKIGQMVLDGGTWNGRRVISGEWIAESTARHMDADGTNGYGYLWWRMAMPTPGGGTDIIAANGWGSQFICVFPEQDLVVVMTGGNQDNGKHMAPGLLMAQTILPGLAAPPVE